MAYLVFPSLAHGQPTRPTLLKASLLRSLSIDADGVIVLSTHKYVYRTTATREYESYTDAVRAATALQATGEFPAPATKTTAEALSELLATGKRPTKGALRRILTECP